ncbi:hypothetical protein [Parapedobacter indicus]|uniref:DUF3575 domain-containing protein n=1 Tax=Parapedobacter indicus TaxID=1477437 RepID=A0A1I3F0R0_9SPHI|nr:hypothetical protein [Parapedobacter indicus]PPL03506.1 hypothetical protein CLV26_102110 [Parapedobacter indicus]SFI04796.1 hypothetical protein SAMN05444682_102110 [Parapedobacter indicus]
MKLLASWKSFIAVALAVIVAQNLVAQQIQSYSMPADDYDANIVKLNALALPFRNISLQYERLVSRKISVAVGLRMIPKGNFPMLDAFESYIDDAETFDELQNIRVSNQAITIEPRFYFGRHDGPRGFYIAPYGRYSTYGLGFRQFEYTVEEEDEAGYYQAETHTMALEGRISGITGGLLFGSQWRIGRWVYLDWWILGPAYGAANGKLSGSSSMPLDPKAQTALEEELENLEIPMLDTEAHVDSKGAKLDMKGPWAGIRTGLAVGIRF